MAKQTTAKATLSQRLQGFVGWHESCLQAIFRIRSQRNGYPDRDTAGRLAREGILATGALVGIPGDFSESMETPKKTAGASKNGKADRLKVEHSIVTGTSE